MRLALLPFLAMLPLLACGDDTDTPKDDTGSPADTDTDTDADTDTDTDADGDTDADADADTDADADPHFGILFVGAQAANLPFAGGIAVPDTSTGFRRQRFTNANGEISFGGAFPSPPPGTQFFVQYWIQDTGAPQNFTGSNAIVGTVP